MSGDQVRVKAIVRVIMETPPHERGSEWVFDCIKIDTRNTPA